ncbi:transcriptional regulator, TetR family [Catenulispora acidiphila DSM 44928]|uniref:Transcriptional regulator, TetR family n=1 Tax=Catenulispora acidiphila (strain DSM 44928 / JCM 14897 / NBRC 102108 / NRRL B-24433 / ID139908) TaxID=479433 RepID=C7QHB1_CATAD|nr:TetR family transcriptional regulator [Catenulispora acidiphila]ACU69050.1 transcriptional regulator, TetR family [Catenulispora acidiphila DSM 44928]
MTSRPDLIGDTAIALLAERGLRGLTHRAVDEAAGLPPGSTSNHARTRSALLETTFARLCRLEAEIFEDAANPGGLLALATLTPETAADLVAAQLHDTLTHRREQALARFELALEATRRPELRAIYDTAGATFREPARGLMAALGATDPDRAGRSFIAFSEGILFDSVAGAGSRKVPTQEEIRDDLLELFRGMLMEPSP